MSIERLIAVIMTIGLVASVGGSVLGAEPGGTLAPWGEPFSTDKDKAYTCVRAAGAITIDGKLDEPAWAKAQTIENFMVPPRFDWIKFEMMKAYRAHSRTFAKLLWDDKYLYFGAELEDRDIYCVTPAGHNHPFSTDDIIELFLKPSDELPYYWELHVVPSGGTRSYFYARRGAGGDARWMVKNPGMEARVALVGTLNNWEDRDSKWIVEMRIAWSAFTRTGGKPKMGDLWRFLVSRYDYSVYLEEGVELSAAAPLPIQSYHLYEYYPYMVFAE